MDGRSGPFATPAQRPEAAVRQGGVYPAFGNAGVDPLDQIVEAAGEPSRNEPAARGERAVGRDQMFPPLKHRE